MSSSKSNSASEPKPADSPASTAGLGPSEAPVRVRFAPSPTGLLHLGSIRSGLFNWLWARHTEGVFVLRIEDTDRQRLVPGALDQILDAHEALGITPDEGPAQGGAYGPYIQSERHEQGIYREHAEKLVQTGALYRCWCSPERLEKLRAEAQERGLAFKYDRHCLKPENHRSHTEPHVLRFRIPDEPQTIAWDDAVRGRLEFSNRDLDDFVAVKTDGFPTYQFANVVDDHLMAISHVLRADEWIPSTPKHLLLYAAFGWQPPIFAHLPAVLGPTGGKKLSKRDGARSVQDYVADGYLPEALRSFLATLGWNDGTTKEIYTTLELIDRFSLDRVQKSPARFDLERLTWVNGKLIRELWENNRAAELLTISDPFWPSSAAQAGTSYRNAVLGLVYDRLHTLADLPEFVGFFFTDPTAADVKAAWPTKLPAGADPAAWLERTVQEIETSLSENNFHAPTIEDHFRNELAPKLGLEKPGPLFMCLRAALTGRTATPGLFDTMAVLGRPTVLRRLASAGKFIA